MSVQTEIARISSAVTAQTLLIDQIRGVVSSKAGGSGNGMKGFSGGTCGSFVLDTDVTDSYSISHDLGKVPNFFYLFVEGSQASGDFPDYVVSEFHAHDPVSNNGTEKAAITFQLYGKTDGSAFTGGLSTRSEVGCTADALNVYLGSRKLKAGIRYNWVCGVIDRM